jgi:hypothetical protein
VISLPVVLRECESVTHVKLSEMKNKQLASESKSLCLPPRGRVLFAGGAFASVEALAEAAAGVAAGAAFAAVEAETEAAAGLAAGGGALVGDFGRSVLGGSTLAN